LSGKGRGIVRDNFDPNRKLFLPLRPDLRFVAMRKSTSLVSNRSTDHWI